MPVFDRHLGRIEAEHTELVEVVDALAVSLDHLATAAPAGRWTPAHTEARALAVDLQQVMGAHLDFEDADVLPLYVRHFGAAEYEELGERAIEAAAGPRAALHDPVGDVARDAVRAADDARRRPVRLQGAVVRVTRRAHDRQVAAALGARARPVPDAAASAAATREVR